MYEEKRGTETWSELLKDKSKPKKCKHVYSANVLTAASCAQKGTDMALGQFKRVLLLPLRPGQRFTGIFSLTRHPLLARLSMNKQRGTASEVDT